MPGSISSNTYIPQTTTTSDTGVSGSGSNLSELSNLNNTLNDTIAQSFSNGKPSKHDGNRPRSSGFKETLRRELGFKPSQDNSYTPQTSHHSHGRDSNKLGKELAKELMASSSDKASLGHDAMDKSLVEMKNMQEAQANMALNVGLFKLLTQTAEGLGKELKKSGQTFNSMSG